MSHSHRNMRVDSLFMLAVVALHSPTLDHAHGAEQLSVEIVANYERPSADYDLPDLLGFEAKALRDKAPREFAGKVAIVPAEGEPLLSEAIRRDRGDDLRRRQGGDLRVIDISDGAVSLADIVRSIDNPQIAEAGQEAITLRLPLLVRPGATLLIDGAETPTLRLSTDRGSFIINGGTLFIIDAFVTAWTEADDSPTHFVEKYRFRPFLASMIRSQTYLVASRFECLGYAAATAYGVSLSTQPERIHGEPTPESPEGVISGCEFNGLYYGFYSYEARDVAIVGNTYTDSIVYGIDPHDRTTRLTIVGNTTTGTRERHGIIGSRGVSHSLIAKNDTHGNHGSGIMLDRECHNVVVAENQVHSNGQGIAIYESPSNRILRNQVSYNQKSALRVRNSVGIVAVENTFIGNDDYALDISARRLDDHVKRVERGDLYEARVEASVFGLRTAGNYGFAKAVGLGTLRLAGVGNARAADLRVADRPATVQRRSGEDDLRFGSELKPLTGQLNRVFNADDPLVVIQGCPLSP